MANVPCVVAQLQPAVCLTSSFILIFIGGFILIFSFLCLPSKMLCDTHYLQQRLTKVFFFLLVLYGLQCKIALTRSQRLETGAGTQIFTHQKKKLNCRRGMVKIERVGGRPHGIIYSQIDLLLVCCQTTRMREQKKMQREGEREKKNSVICY